jgi:lincosamide nucleotidyltransferase A/C/D/E
MALSDVLELLELADRVGVEFWVDGGWGVDAALGVQTRTHSDLDILIERRHEPSLAAALVELGFAPVERDDTRAWNYVLGDGRGREVDFHVVERLPDGNWAYGPQGGPVEAVIPEQAMTAIGRIGDRPVRCLTPQAQVGYHTGYPVDAEDWADVSALCERFGIPVPEDYRAFQSEG